MRLGLTNQVLLLRTMSYACTCRTFRTKATDFGRAVISSHDNIGYLPVQLQFNLRCMWAKESAASGGSSFALWSPHGRADCLNDVKGPSGPSSECCALSVWAEQKGIGGSLGPACSTQREKKRTANRLVGQGPKTCPVCSKRRRHVPGLADILGRGADGMRCWQGE